MNPETLNLPDLQGKQFNIKWQTYGVVSVILALLVLLFLIVADQWSERSFETSRQQAHNAYEQQLARLMESSANKMIQISSSVSLNRNLMEALREGRLGVISVELDALDWNLQTDAGFEVVGLFGADKLYSAEFSSDAERQDVNRVLSEEQPIWRIDCTATCRILTYTALLYQGEIMGVLGLAEPMSHILLRFKHAANIDTGLLGNVGSGLSTEQEIQQWEKALVALTTPELSYAVIDRASTSYTLEQLSSDARLVNVDQDLFELKLIPVQDQSQLLVIQNVSQTYSEFQASNQQRLYFSIVALLGGELALLLFLWRPLNRVKAGETLVDYVIHQSEQLKLRTQAMLTAQSFSESVCDTVSAPILVLNNDLSIASSNAYGRKLLKLSGQQLTGKDFCTVLHQDSAFLRQRLANVVEGALSSFEHTALVADSQGAQYEMLWRFSPVYRFEEAVEEIDSSSNNETCLMAVGMPAVSSIEKSACIWLENHDSQTGLLNRKGLYQLLDDEMAQGKASGTEILILRLDLPMAKVAEDAARHLSDAISESDCAHSIKAAARLDTNEFALWLYSRPKFELGTQAQCLFDNLSCVLQDRLSYQLGMRMGLTLVRQEDLKAYEVVQRAGSKVN